eukprot:756207-Hanusia_phi.AAC.7
MNIVNSRNLISRLLFSPPPSLHLLLFSHITSSSHRDSPAFFQPPRKESGEVRGGEGGEERRGEERRGEERRRSERSNTRQLSSSTMKTT